MLKVHWEGYMTKVLSDEFVKELLEKYNSVYSWWCVRDNYFPSLIYKDTSFSISKISVPYAGRNYTPNSMMLGAFYMKGVITTRYIITPKRFMKLYELGAFTPKRCKMEVVAKYFLGKEVLWDYLH